eukprot:4814509-Lingulodinium_polyedra.AAC.1
MGGTSNTAAWAIYNSRSGAVERANISCKMHRPTTSPAKLPAAAEARRVEIHTNLASRGTNALSVEFGCRHSLST